MNKKFKVAVEVVEFYPDTLISLECLIIFKYKDKTSMCQFENFYEIKSFIFEFEHISTYSDLIINFQIYGGGHEKVFVGEGNIELKQNLFNSVSRFYCTEKNNSFLLTKSGRDFLFMNKMSEFYYNNCYVRTLIEITNNDFKDVKINFKDLVKKIEIINNKESDEVNILNESSEEKKDENYYNDPFLNKAELDEYLNNKFIKLSPINKKEDDSRVNDKIEEFNDDIKEHLFDDNTHFDSYFNNPELYYRDDYPKKKDLSETKSLWEQKKVLIHDLISFEEIHLEKSAKLFQNLLKLKEHCDRYKFKYLKQAKLNKLLKHIKSCNKEKINILNNIDKMQTTLINGNKHITKNIFGFLKKAFSVKYDQNDIHKTIQTKYKEESIKNILIKCFKKCDIKSFNYLGEEKLKTFIALNNKLNLIDHNKLQETVNKKYTANANINEDNECLDQIKFDHIYKNVDSNRNRVNINRESKLKSKSLIITDHSVRKSFLNQSIINNDFSEVAQIMSKNLENSTISEDETDKTFFNIVDNWIGKNPNYRSIEFSKLSENIYEYNKEKFILNRLNSSFTDNDSLSSSNLETKFEILTKDGKYSVEEFLKKHCRKKFKNQNLHNNIDNKDSSISEFVKVKLLERSIKKTNFKNKLKYFKKQNSSSCKVKKKYVKI